MSSRFARLVGGGLGSCLLVVGLAGCSYTSARINTYATAAPPKTPAQTAAADQSTQAGSSTQASCGNDASFKNFEILRQYSVGSGQSHTNEDGSIDASFFNFGGQTDAQGLQAVTTGLGSLAGMLIKGAATGGAGAATFALVPNKDGTTFRLVPVQPGPTREAAASRKWDPASASGCIPTGHAPGFDVGGQQQGVAAPSPPTVAPPHPPQKEASAYVHPVESIPMLEAADDTDPPPPSPPRHHKKTRKPHRTAAYVPVISL